MSDELLRHLQNQMAAHDLCVESAPTVQEASHQLNEKSFHLVIMDLDYLRSIGHAGWLESIRHVSFVPLVILPDTPEEDMIGTAFVFSL